MAITDRVFLRQVRHVEPDLHDRSTRAARRQITRDFGAIVPPFALHLPVPAALCASWAIVREPTWGPRVDRATKEAVAVAVSAANACPYCVDVHTTTLRVISGTASATAVAAGAADDIRDTRLRAVVRWARASRDPNADVVRRRPFPDEQAPELIGVALAYHYINRMVNVFASPSPFPARGPMAKSVFTWVAMPVFRTWLARTVRRGESLDLLPPAPLPDDLGWARPDPLIADAFGRAAAAFDAVGVQAIPETVRGLVSTRLREWRGEDPGLSRAWVDAAVEDLPQRDQPIGRLALLSAFASYQVDDRVIADARAGAGPHADARLIATGSWASFAAARRIGSWLNDKSATASGDRDTATSR